jgi:quercetin dioxygenase-like cupin family protein
MAYHVVDPAELGQWDDRPADVRSVSEAADLDYQDAKLGMRIYEAEPGQQLPTTYHYHEEQVEAFYVVSGDLAVETPEGEFTVAAGEVFVAHPGSPHRAYDPDDADAPVRVLAIGAPTVDDAVPYDPGEGGAGEDGAGDGDGDGEA